MTRHSYRGINTLLLWVAQDENAYLTSSWASFKQWGGQGRFVRKGEKGTPIFFFKTLEREKDGETKTFPMMRCSWVFNEQQLDGFEPVAPVEHTPGQRHQEAMRWYDSQVGTMKIEHGGAPSYSPSRDVITLPNPESFTTLDEYWATLFHEAVHWTGHADRLDRGKRNAKGSPAYAAEELVAEIGAAMMNASFGIDTSNNNAAYLRSWLKGFTDKRAALFKAAKQAGDAFGFLHPTANVEQAEVAA